MLRRSAIAPILGNKLTPPVIAASLFSRTRLQSTTGSDSKGKTESSNSNSTDNKEKEKESNAAEIEREMRARQELMQKMMGSGNPFMRAFGQQQKLDDAAAGSNNSNANSGSTTPQQSSSTTQQAYQQMFASAWANSPNHKAGRFFSTVIITICGYIMLKRIGVFGDYTHLSLPYYAASPSDAAKWCLFMFNVEESRRRQLQQTWEQQRAQMPPNMNFFDFVDQHEANWRSSPNNSGDAVINTVGAMMVQQGPPRAIANVKGTLSGASPMGLFSPNLSSPEERAKRIDNLMTTNAQMASTGFMGLSPVAPQLPSSFGGAPSIASPPLASSSSSWSPQGQHAQQAANPWGYPQTSPNNLQQQHYPQQQQWNPYWMQQQQQQQQYYGYGPQQGQQQQQQSGNGSNGSSNNGVHGSTPFADQQQQQQQQPTQQNQQQDAVSKQ